MSRAGAVIGSLVWLALAPGTLALYVPWALTRWRRQHVPDRVVLGRYFLLAGSTRFAIEFIRVNTRILGPLTLAHLISLVLIAIGTVMVLRGQCLHRTDAEKKTPAKTIEAK